MHRFEIVHAIGRKFNTNNLENGEFSYSKALSQIGKTLKTTISPREKEHRVVVSSVDLRFESERLVILVECKNKFSKWKKCEIYQQLQQYVDYEKELSNKKIVVILAETDGDGVMVWGGDSIVIDDAHRLAGETTIKRFDEYEDMCFGTGGNK